jgi:hypothetical protein
MWINPGIWPRVSRLSSGPVAVGGVSERCRPPQQVRASCGCRCGGSLSSGRSRGRGAATGGGVSRHPARPRPGSCGSPEGEEPLALGALTALDQFPAQSLAEHKLLPVHRLQQAQGLERHPGFVLLKGQPGGRFRLVQPQLRIRNGAGRRSGRWCPSASAMPSCTDVIHPLWCDVVGAHYWVGGWGGKCRPRLGVRVHARHGA